MADYLNRLRREGLLGHSALLAGVAGLAFVLLAFDSPRAASIGLLIAAATLIVLGLAVQRLAGQIREGSDVKQRADELSRAVTETAVDAIVSTDNRDNITHFNHAAERMFGYSIDELIGRPLTLIVPEGFRAAYERSLDRDAAMLETDVTGQTVESVGRKKDGREFPLEAALSAWIGSDGIFFTGILRDISEHRRVEGVMQRSAEKIHHLYDNAPCGYHSLDEDGTFLQMNETELAWLGYEWDEVVGKMKLSDLAAPESLRAFQREFEQLKHAGQAHNRELQMIRKDGTVMPVSLSTTVVEDGDGNPVMTRSTVVDITARKKAEAELSRASAIVEASDDAITAMSGDGVITSWNPGARKIFGYSAKEMIGQPMSRVVPHHRLAHERQIVKQVLAGERLEPYETERVSKDGALIEVSVTVSPIRNELGQIVGASSIARDITAKKQAEDEANRLKDEFIGVVSHELRMPLTSIKGYLELLLEGEAGEFTQQAHKFLEVIDRNASRLERLMGDLVFVAQVEAGEFAVKDGVVELDEIVSGCVAATQSHANKKQIQLRLETEAIPRLPGDRDRLIQLVDNLLLNAIKYTPEGGRVDVRLHSENKQAVLEVQDTGVGIPRDEQERVFERFFRASTVTADGAPGVGLGLSIVRAIAEGHGGRVEVRSEEGAGATFRVELPLHKRSRPKRAMSVSEAKSQAPKGGPRARNRAKTAA